MPAAPGGSVSQLRFHRGTGELAIVTNSAQGPSQVHVLNLATGRHEPWTLPVTPPGLDLSQMPDQQIVRWQSFDGRTMRIEFCVRRADEPDSKSKRKSGRAVPVAGALDPAALATLSGFSAAKRSSAASMSPSR